MARRGSKEPDAGEVSVIMAAISALASGTPLPVVLRRVFREGRIAGLTQAQAIMAEVGASFGKGARRGR